MAKNGVEAPQICRRVAVKRNRIVLNINLDMVAQRQKKQTLCRELIIIHSVGPLLETIAKNAK